MSVKDERAIRERIASLEAKYDEYDPPSSPLEDEMEVAVLRAIEELEWACGDREDPPSFSE